MAEKRELQKISMCVILAVMTGFLSEVLFGLGGLKSFGLFVCFYQSCLSSNDFRLFRFSCTSACRELQNTPALWGEGREEEIVIATVEETLDYNSVKVHI